MGIKPPQLPLWERPPSPSVVAAGMCAMVGVKGQTLVIVPWSWLSDTAACLLFTRGTLAWLTAPPALITRILYWGHQGVRCCSTVRNVSLLWQGYLSTVLKGRARFCFSCTLLDVAQGFGLLFPVYSSNNDVGWWFLTPLVMLLNSDLVGSPKTNVTGWHTCWLSLWNHFSQPDNDDGLSFWHFDGKRKVRRRKDTASQCQWMEGVFPNFCRDWIVRTFTQQDSLLLCRPSSFSVDFKALLLLKPCICRHKYFKGGCDYARLRGGVCCHLHKKDGFSNCAETKPNLWMMFLPRKGWICSGAGVVIAWLSSIPGSLAYELWCLQRCVTGSFTLFCFQNTLARL